MRASNEQLRGRAGGPVRWHLGSAAVHPGVFAPLGVAAAVFPAAFVLW